MIKEPCFHVWQAIAPYSIPSNVFRPDMEKVSFDVRIIVFDFIAKRFFKGIEASFDSNSGAIKYGIKYRDYDNHNQGSGYTYGDETGMVCCATSQNNELKLVDKVHFEGEENITTRIFEEFKKFAAEQNLEEAIHETLKPPRRVNRWGLALEELKQFANERGIKYVEKIELM